MTTGIWNGKTYRTDKIDNGFMPDYERVFSALRARPVRLLEIGVAYGGSCALWNDFFTHPDTLIVGLDVAIAGVDVVGQGDDGRIVLVKCDQNDTDGLRAVARRYGPFDIVIDDGAHRYRETRHCYRTLFGHLREGGHYVIEDWAVGYWKDRQSIFGDDAGNTMVTLIADIMQSIPEAAIAGFQIILDTHKSLAFFRKGAAWQS